MRRSPLGIVVASVVAGSLCVLSTGTATAASGGGTRPTPSCPWVGSTAPVATRVGELMARMTTGEELSMVHGLDSNTDASSSGPVYAGETAGVAALCIPALHLEDGPAGVGDGLTGVTQLPAPVALAASWDPGLSGAYGAVIGAEQRAKGTNVELGPTVNIVRDPRWGRAFESLGEDPYLAGQLAAAEIRGVQAQGVIAMVKHLGVYDEETLRDTPSDDAIVSERAMEEIYLPAFDAAVAQGGAGAVMCSYNEVNGVPACQSPYLLAQVLDGQFGFGGFVASDWFATKSSAPSVDAGLDMQMPDSCTYGAALAQDLADGTVPRALLDAMVRRILVSMFSAGLFDQPAGGDPGTPVSTPGDVSVARLAAEEGTVLLKDAGGVLPLSAHQDRSIALVGTDAGPGALTAGGGSAAVTATSVVTPVQGIRGRAGTGVTVTYDDGSNPLQAVQDARRADVAVVFAGLPEAEDQDLATLELPPGDDELIDAVAKANPHTVVVLNTGSAVAMPWIDDVAGVVEAWYPGQEDGSAVAAVLFGDVDPSGKLPVTFPTSLLQLPDRSPFQWPGVGNIQYAEGVFVGYRAYDAQGETPLYPFGFGLSYTTFRFSRPEAWITPSGDVEVEADVTDTGTRSGADVAQLYAHDPSTTGEPPDQLKGFERVALAPGQRARVRFTVGAGAFAHWDSGRHRWVVSPGRYELRLGDSSRNLPVVATVTVPGELLVGRPTPLPPPMASPLASAPADAQCPKDVVAPAVNGGLSVPSDLWSVSGRPSPF